MTQPREEYWKQQTHHSSYDYCGRTCSKMDPTLDGDKLQRLYKEAVDEHDAHDYERAMHLYKKVLELGEYKMPLKTRMDARETLAVCYHHLKKYGDATKFNRVTLEIMEASPHYGVGHKSTIQIRYNLARALAAASKSGDLSDPKLKEAISIYKQILGTVTAESNGKAFRQTRQSLASALFKRCRYSEAKKLYEQLISEMEAGPQEPETVRYLRLKHEYAGVLYHLKRYDKSKKLFLEIQGDVDSLPNIQRRRLVNLPDSVDRYIAACVEATHDLNLGVARNVAATVTPPDKASRSAEQKADNRRRSSSRLSENETNAKSDPKDTSPKQRSNEKTEVASSRAKPGNIAKKPKGRDDRAAGKTDDDSTSNSNLLPSAGTSKAGSNLAVPSAPNLKGRRSKSDQYLDHGKQTLKQKDPIARPNSAQSSLEVPRRAKKTSRSDSDTTSHKRSVESLRSISRLSGTTVKYKAKGTKSTDSDKTRSSAKAAASLSQPKSKSKSESKPDVGSTPGAQSSESNSITSDVSGVSRTKVAKTAQDTNGNSTTSSKKAAATLSPSKLRSKPDASATPSKQPIRSQSSTSLAHSAIGKGTAEISKKPNDVPTNKSSAKAAETSPHSRSKSEPDTRSRVHAHSAGSQSVASKTSSATGKQAAKVSRSANSNAAQPSTNTSRTSGKAAEKGRAHEVQRGSTKDKNRTPSLHERMPGSWPEEAGATTSDVPKLVVPSSSRSDVSTRTSGSFYSAVSRMNVIQSMAQSAPPKDPDVGELFDLPPNSLNDTDTWFWQLRKYTHTLLGPAIPPARPPVRVAILDSGLANVHNGLSLPMSREGLKKVKNLHFTYKDFAGGDSSSRRDSLGNLHGTWCASLLMQTAPSTELYIANVVRPNIAGQDPKHVAAAIAWAIDERVDIISMSFGWESEKPIVDVQLERARKQGILLFAAASNYGDLVPEHGIYPASKASVSCIYSCRGTGVKSAFNPRPSAGQHNFMFPGEGLTILDQRTHKPVEGVQKDPGKTTERREGTSYATPIAAGTAAMVLELARRELKDSKDLKEVERRLKTVEGMSDIFMAMSKGATDGGYCHVTPWKLLGEKKPIDIVHQNVNETHKWFTLMKILEILHPRFGKYSEESS